MFRNNISFSRPRPRWALILYSLAVSTVLGIAIGLIVYFLVIKSTYYYLGEFQISGFIYNSTCETGSSQEGTNLSKDIETTIKTAFQISNIAEKFIICELIRFLAYSGGSSAQLLLTFKYIPAEKNSMDTTVSAIFQQTLKDKKESWKVVPASVKLTRITKKRAESFTNDCCGRTMVKSMLGGRIIQGKNAQKGAWPWQAALEYKGVHKCGASLISSKWLLTAAHCFQESMNLGFWTVKFGTVIFIPHMTRKVKNIILHKMYRNKTKENDIALMELAEPVSFTRNIRKVCLPEANMKLSENATVVVTGWGNTSEGGTGTIFLREAYMKIIDQKVCRSKAVLSNSVIDTMLCAGFLGGGPDACQNDSGGPLVHSDSRNIWYIVGIVSWGHGCGKKNRPGVYTRVSAYRDWIQSNTGL